MGSNVSFNGTIVSGLGEGAYFMSMPRYQNEIKKKLGFKAYPGTLNLEVDEKEISSVKKCSKIQIMGFKKGNKEFGGAYCYISKIRDISGAIIMPHITKHTNIIEFIAPVHVKYELKVKDGDKIKVELIG